MVANIRGFTPNYNFKLINFDTPRWHTHEYSNWNLADSLLAQAGVPHLRGEWQNSTLYLIGDRVIDSAIGNIYRNQIEHTSAPNGTFEEDRTLRPDLWTIQLIGVPLFRGEWTTNTNYAVGDIVFTNEYQYYLCTIEHTSAVFGTDFYWQLIFDATEAVNDANQSALDAAQSALDAATSASEADADAVAAESSKNQALASATSASGSMTAAASSATAAATSETNAATSATAAANSAATLYGTSVTPNTISSGAKTFTTQTGKRFDAGMFLTIVNASATSNIISGVSTAYSGTTLNINIIEVIGGGSSSNWNIYVSGAPGIDGTGLTWRGSWSAATPYIINDAVIAPNGSSYICVTAHTNSQPPSVNWNVLAAAGSVVIADDAVLPQMLDADTAPKQLLMRDRLNFTSRSGDTMTGMLKLPATAPTVDEAVRRDYVDLKAPLASPVFTGDPQAPTPLTADNDTSIATTAFVKSALAAADLSAYAPIASPTFIGDPKAPTPTAGDSDTTIATTAFVQGAISTSTTNKVDKAGDTMTGPLAINAVFGGTTGQLNLVCTDPGALGFVGDLYHNSTSPISADIVGMFRFHGNNSAAAKVQYSVIFSTITNPTAGAESGKLTFQTWLGGATRTLDYDGQSLLATSPTTLGTAGSPWSSIYLSGGGPYTVATVSDYIQNVSNKLLTASAAWSAVLIVTLADAASYTPDFNAGLDFNIVLGGTGGSAKTMNAPTNITKQGQKGIIYLSQDATSGRTITWNAVWKFPGGVKPTLSTTANACDTISYVVKTASDIYCTFSADFK